MNWYRNQWVKSCWSICVGKSTNNKLSVITGNNCFLAANFLHRYFYRYLGVQKRKQSKKMISSQLSLTKLVSSRSLVIGDLNFEKLSNHSFKKWRTHHAMIRLCLNKIVNTHYVPLVVEYPHAWLISFVFFFFFAFLNSLSDELAI